MVICVFGSASDKIDTAYKVAVEELGRVLAERGHALVFGAGGHGLMGAVARGVYEKRGKICGVVPKFFRDEGVEELFEHCEPMIFTETMAERKSKMEDLADAFIITPGGVGTLEEFFEVLTLKQLGRHTKPIAIYDINGYYQKTMETLRYAMGEKFINKNCEALYCYSENVQEIFDYIENDKQIKRNIRDLKNG